MLAKQSWVTIFFAFINYLFDFILLYIIWLILIYFDLYQDNNGVILLMLLLLPITTIILVFGCIFGVAINISRSSDESEHP